MADVFGSPAMIGLNLLMIIFTFWVCSTRFSAGMTLRWVTLPMIIWLSALHIMLSTENMFAHDISGTAFFLVVLTGVALVGTLLLGIQPVRKALLSLDQEQLMLFQGIRIYYGAVFLIQGGLGLLPSSFGLIDGLTHISAGFFCLIAAFSCAFKHQSRRHTWFANAFGLADILIVATSLSFLLLDQIGPHHPMMYAVFLPAPIWLWAHVISIYKLLTDHEGASTRIAVSQ